MVTTSMLYHVFLSLFLSSFVCHVNDDRSIQFYILVYKKKNGPIDTVDRSKLLIMFEKSMNRGPRPLDRFFQTRIFK